MPFSRHSQAMDLTFAPMNVHCLKEEEEEEEQSSETERHGLRVYLLRDVPYTLVTRQLDSDQYSTPQNG